MSPSLPTALVVLCLVIATVGAQANTREALEGVRFIELTEEPGVEAPEVFIRPGLSTNFNFDTDLARAADGRDRVDLARREAFTRVDVGQASLRLIPSATLKPGDRLGLQVFFQDGAAPAFARFTLVVSADRAERVVEVYRDARPAESYRQEAQAAHAATARCLDALERLKAERAGPGGLLGLLLSRQVDSTGVKTRDLTKSITKPQGNPLDLSDVWTYRSATQVIVEVAVTPPVGTRPWKAESASLTSRRRPESKALTVWQEAPVAEKPDLPQRLFVVADASPGELQGTYTLTLKDAGTERTFVLGNVTFP
jgi:uncharacterized protein (TIGR02268 family)